MRIRNYLSSTSPIENGLKQRDALLPLLFNFSLEYSIRKVLDMNEEVMAEDGHIWCLGVDSS